MFEQDFLFGNPNVVDDGGASQELRLLALNLKSPSVNHIPTQLTWIYQSRCNVLILTEVRAGEAMTLLVKDLESSGFLVTRDQSGGAGDDRYHAIVASKGYSLTPLKLSFKSPRIAAARLASHIGPIDIVGMYSPTNGMTGESSYRRAAFQAAVVDALKVRNAADSSVPLVVGGDLNVLADEPSPARSLFEDHDFAFYRAFGEQLEMVDAYKLSHPDGKEQTWTGRNGAQRLDHIFVSHSLADRLAGFIIDHGTRQEKISDHSALRLTVA